MNKAKTHHRKDKDNIAQPPPFEGRAVKYQHCH